MDVFVGYLNLCNIGNLLVCQYAVLAVWLRQNPVTKTIVREVFLIYFNVSPPFA